jgi:hypothetical protein
MGTILVHEGPNLVMQNLLFKLAHPTNLICAGEFSGSFVAVIRESQKFGGQTMLLYYFRSHPLRSLIIIALGGKLALS